MSKKTIRVELAGESNHNSTYHYAYLDIPAEASQILDALQKVRIYGEADTPPLISVSECELLPQLTERRLMHTTVDEMNYLAQRLAELDETEQAVLRAVAPKVFTDDEYEIVDIRDVIRMTYGLDEVPVAVHTANDTQLGQLVIDDEMNEDVNAIPESSLYLLDRAKIGELQRKNDGGVFVGDLYIVAGGFELPEPENDLYFPSYKSEKPYAFRLLVSKAPDGDEDTSESSKMITLPIAKEEADRVAASLGEARIEDCVYYNFESAITQISADMFGDMRKFDELNRLAEQIVQMPPRAMVTFKAALESEGCDSILKALDIAGHLHEYQIDVNSESADDFMKDYLLSHLDTRFDGRWINTLMTGKTGSRLFECLGATVTDYGVISARGRSLTELVSYDKPEEMTTVPADEKYEVIEMLGYAALFTNGRINPEDVPEGLHRYDLRYCEESGTFLSVEKSVGVNHGGSVLMKEELDLGEHGFIAFDDDSSPNFTGEEMTPQEFMDAYPDEEQTGGMKLD